MRRIDVLITIEHVDRELDAASCVAYMLCTRFGFDVEIRNFYADYPLALRLNPKVLAVPFFYFKGHSPMQQYLDRWPQARVLNLAWEQILYKMNQTIKVPSDDVAKRQVWHVCWTREYRSFLQELGVDERKLFWTGNPVMKFYDAPYRGYFAERKALAARYGLPPQTKWVLFPENYRWGFLSDQQIENFVSLGGQREELLEARGYCQRALAKVLKWMSEACSNSEIVIILRPRPATSIAQIEAFARKSIGEIPTSLRIVKGESAREWIIACDHVMSSYSTTLIEASLCGKPVHLVSPEPLPEGLQDEWYDKLPWIESAEAFVKAATTVASPDSGDQLGQWARDRLLGNGDPIANIAAAIASLHPRNQGVAYENLLDAVCGAPMRIYSPPPALSRWLDERRKRLMRSVEYQKHLTRRYPGYSFTLQKHEKDLFSSQDVHRRMEAWRRVAG